MPASSQQSPTSATRDTAAPQHAGSGCVTSSIHGRCSSGSASTAAGSTASSRSSAREPTTVSSLAVLAAVEGQRQAPVALARDAPVAHVGEPVVHAAAACARAPRDGARWRPMAAARISSTLMNHSSTSAEDHLPLAAPARRDSCGGTRLARTSEPALARSRAAIVVADVGAASCPRASRSRRRSRPSRRAGAMHGEAVRRPSS